MSKLRLNQVNYNEDDFVVRLDENTQYDYDVERVYDEKNTEVEILDAKRQASEIIEQAKVEAREVKENIISEAQKEKDKMLSAAQIEAEDLKSNLVSNSKEEAEKLIENSKAEIEQARIEATRQGYEEGHKDAIEKAQEELIEQIEGVNRFCLKQQEIRNKILKSVSRDILNITFEIAKKILLKELDKDTLDKIIKQSIALLESKEEIKITVSEKYAKILYNIQNKNEDDIELDFDKFNQYSGFELNYNPKYPEDTIIIENPQERFNASIQDQLAVIIRDIYEKSQNGNLDLEQYSENNETERTE